MENNNVLTMTEQLVSLILRASVLSKEIVGKYSPNCATLFLAMMLDEEMSCLGVFEIKLSLECGSIEFVLPEISEIISSLKQSKNFFKKVFKKTNVSKVDEDYVPEELLNITEAYDITFSENLYKALVVASDNCKAIKKQYVDVGDLLFVILNMGNNSCIRMLKNYKTFNTEEFCEFLLDFGAAPFGNVVEGINLPRTISKFCTILNNKYEKDQKCDILNRDEEIFSVLNIISKKTKRNAMLIGHPGVGKTAIVEAITQSIVNETCPKKFFDYKVIEVDVNSMIAGTTYRGQFEEKVDSLIKFVEENENIIIFIDEIHQIMGAGNSSGGGVDFAGAIKPLLSRDKAIFIGATTIEEYEKYFKNDLALKRRFEVVEVKEPKLSEIKPMIKGKVNTLEKYHNVSISNETLDYVLTCAYAFNTSTCNPDKTIDLLDKSLAIASMTGGKKLRRNHVNKVFEYNYKALMELNESDKMATAWHEAGHFVMNYLLENVTCNKVILASIVPTHDNLGVTVTEEKLTITPSQNEEAMFAEIKILLAGRVAQSFYKSDYDAGASSDLRKATSILISRITELGMDKQFENLALCYDGRGDGILFTEKNKEIITKVAKEKIDKLYKETSEILTTNYKLLELVANMLYTKNIVSLPEIIERYAAVVKSD